MKRLIGLVLMCMVGCVAKNDTIEKDWMKGVEVAATGHEYGTYPAPIAVKNCPDDMVEVEGEYCPNVEEVCLYGMDKFGNRLPKPYKPNTSCGEYKFPTRCLSDKTVYKHFCIDKYEFPNKQGEIPRDWMTWYDAKNEATKLGKRLCTSSEWTLAAEGPNMNPLPYGDGYHRDRTMCNIDHPEKLDVFKAKKPDDAMAKTLRSLLVPSGSMPECYSAYGVHDMSGNVDEWVINESGRPYVSGLKGGHIWHVRQAARPETEIHGPSFAWYETSTRLCKDIQ